MLITGRLLFFEFLPSYNYLASRGLLGKTCFINREFAKNSIHGSIIWAGEMEFYLEVIDERSSH